MNLDVSVIYVVTSFTTTLTCWICSLLSIINNSENKVNINFSVISFIIGIWSSFTFIMFIFKDASIFLNIGKFMYIFVVFIPPFLFYLLFSTINISNKNTKLIISAFLTISFIFLLFIPSNLFVKEIVFNGRYFCVTPGYVYFAFIIYFILSSIYYVVLFTKQYYRILHKNQKEQLKFLISAFFIAVISIGIHFISAYSKDVEKIPVDILTMLWAIFMFYFIYRYEYLNIKKILLKTAIFTITYCIGLGIPLYILLLYKNLLLAFVILFFVSIIIPLLANYLQMKTEKLLFTQQDMYQQLLFKTSEEFVKKSELREVCHIVINLIMEQIKVKFISIFIYDKDEKKYVCLDTAGEKINFVDKFDITDNIIMFVNSKNKAFLLNNDTEHNEIFDIIYKDAVVVAPIKLKEQLIGFIIIGKKQNDDMYLKKDLEIFDTVSNQTVVAIQNIWIRKKSIQQQEKLVKTEKLATIGGMADGLAHQIKNRLNNFALIGSSMKMEFDLLKKSFDNFSSKKEFVKFFDANCAKFPQIIGDNVEQTLQLLQNILEFAKSKDSLQFETFSLKQTIQQVEQLVKLKHSKYKYSLFLNIPTNDNIYAIKTQIQEILFNFVDNALEATIAKKEYLKKDKTKLNKYKPEIKISLRSFSNKWQIIIEDNGIGIKQEDKIKLFSAFFTTKINFSSNSGSGIGIYIAKKMIVEAHNGTVKFKSKYGKGTSFIITLPKNS